MTETTKIIARNKQAFHEFEIMKRFEAGIVLSGTEVKALRAGKINFKDGWINIDPQGEAFLMQVHISPYTFGNIYNHVMDRPRKLLLHKKELEDLAVALHAKGMSAIPLSVYLKGNRFKFEIALARGKKLHDKRESARERDADRDMERAMRGDKRGD